MIPEHVKEGALKAWPGIDTDNLRCECEGCDQVSTCDWAWDLYGCYTTDGDVNNTGPLCLK